MIFLLTLAALAVLLLLLTLPRTGVRASGKDGALRVWLRYGRVQIGIYPPPRLLRGRPKKPAREPARAHGPSADLSALDLGDTVCLLLDLLDDLRLALRIDTLRADVVLATGDAAKTGILLGECAALLGMITPVLENTFDIRDYRLSIDGDFQSRNTRWQAELACSVRPIRLLLALWKRRQALLRLAQTLKITQTNQGS